MFCNDAERRIVSVVNLITMVLMVVYLLFDYIRCQFTGNFVNGFAEPDVLTFLYAVLIEIAAYIIMMLFSVLLLKMNKKYIYDSSWCLITTIPGDVYA